MNLIALTVARNEAWCIAASVRASLRWCDSAVVLDHCSTDRTPEHLDALAREYPGRVHRLEERDPVWHESRYRQRMLDKGRAIGGTHFAIIDADEMLTANLVPSIRVVVADLAPASALRPAWVCCWRSLTQHRRDGSIWSHARVPMAFADAHGVHWVSGDSYDIHTRQPRGTTHADAMPAGGLLHLQHANWERLLWKQLHYRLIEVLRFPEQGVTKINARYAPTTDETNIRLADIPPHWLPSELDDVDLAAPSWHRGEVLRLVEEHGREAFAGVDFLGLL